MLGNTLKPVHILILLIVVLLLFGAKRLPDLAKSVGESLKIFKSELKDLSEDDKPSTPVTPPTATPPAAARDTAPPATLPPPYEGFDGGTPPRT